MHINLSACIMSHYVLCSLFMVRKGVAVDGALEDARLGLHHQLKLFILTPLEGGANNQKEGDEM